MNNQKLAKDIEQAINRYSAENGSDTPDFILADYLVACLETFNKTNKSREIWYGRGRKAVTGPVPVAPSDPGSPTVSYTPDPSLFIAAHTLNASPSLAEQILNASPSITSEATRNPNMLTGGGVYPPDGTDTEDDTPAVKPFATGTNEVNQLIDGLHSLLKKISSGPSGSGVRPDVTPVHYKVFARYQAKGGALHDSKPVLVKDHKDIKKAVSQVHASIVNGNTKPDFENVTDNDGVIGYSVILRTVTETSV